MSPKTVVFVCTGNYYRSRFSEYLFNALAKEGGLHWRATSRGLKAWMAANEGPISEFAVHRLTAMGIPFDGKRFPIQLSTVDFEDADLVVAVKKAEHHPMMIEKFPDWAERITYWHIDDVDCATADEALPICESCVRHLVQTLLAEQNRRGEKSFVAMTPAAAPLAPAPSFR
jgi:protein-tyrosine phosphatase